MLTKGWHILCLVSKVYRTTYLLSFALSITCSKSLFIGHITSYISGTSCTNGVFEGRPDDSKYDTWKFSLVIPLLVAGWGFTYGIQWSNLKLIMKPTPIVAQIFSKLEKQTSSTSLLVMIFHQTAMRIVSRITYGCNRPCNVFFIWKMICHTIFRPSLKTICYV